MRSLPRALAHYAHRNDVFFDGEEKSLRFKYRAMSSNALIYVVVGLIYMSLYPWGECPRMTTLVVMSVFVLVASQMRMSPEVIVTVTLPLWHGILLQWATVSPFSTGVFTVLMGPVILQAAVYTSFAQTIASSVAIVFELIAFRAYIANNRVWTLDTALLWQQIDDEFFFYLFHIVLMTRYSFMFCRLRTHVDSFLTRERQLVQRKEDFLADTTHEIRSPMTAILHIAELLASSTNSKQHPLVVALQTSCRSLMKFLNQVIDSAQLDGSELRHVPFDLKTTLHDGANAFQGAALVKQLSLNVVLDPTSPRFVKGDPFVLKKIILNLVSNGVKFTREGGVTVSARVDRIMGSRLVLVCRVADTGPGLAADSTEIFEAYYRPDRETKHKAFGSTGLGLSICKQAVDKMSGTITKVAAANGVGTTFEFTVPLEAASADEEAALRAELAVDRHLFKVEETNEEMLTRETDDITSGLLCMDTIAAVNDMLASEGSEPKVEHGDGGGLLARHDRAMGKPDVSPVIELDETTDDRATPDAGADIAVSQPPQASVSQKLTQRRAGGRRISGGHEEQQATSRLLGARTPSDASVASTVLGTAASTASLQTLHTLSGSMSDMSESHERSSGSLDRSQSSASQASSTALKGKGSSDDNKTTSNNADNNADDATIAATSTASTATTGLRGDASPVTRTAGVYRVLLVEDTSIIRRVVRMGLERAGHTCGTAADGQLGYDEYISALTAGRRYDVVLMDCAMPNVDGYESTRRIRAAEVKLGMPRVPIIAVTANTTRDCRDECAASGMDAIVEKPFETPVLLEAIRGVLADGAPLTGRFSLKSA